VGGGWSALCPECFTSEGRAPPPLIIEERVGWAPFILGFLIIFVSILVLRLRSLHLMKNLALEIRHVVY